MNIIKLFGFFLGVIWLSCLIPTKLSFPSKKSFPFYLLIITYFLSRNWFISISSRTISDIPVSVIQTFTTQFSYSFIFRVLLNGIYLVSAVFFLFLGRIKSRISRPFFFYILFSIFALSTTVISDFQFYTFVRAFELLLIVLFYWLIYQQMRIKNFFQAVLIQLRIAKFFLGFQLVIYFLFPNHIYIKSPSMFGFILGSAFPYYNPNGLALSSSIFLVLSLINFRVFSKEDSNFFKCIDLILLSYFVFFTQSRSTWFILIVILPIIAFFIEEKHIKSKLSKVFLVLIILLLLLLFFNPELILNVFKRGSTSISSLSGRMIFWNKALEIFKNAPLIGNGYAYSTRFLVMKDLGFGSISTLHGTFFDLLVNVGIIGTLIFYLMLVNLYIGVFRLKKINYRYFKYCIVFILLITIKSITNTYGVYSDNISNFLIISCLVSGAMLEK